MAFLLPPFMEIFLVSLVVAFLTTLLTKFLTNQNALKNLRKEMKSLQEQVKRAQKSGSTKEANQLSSRMLKLSGEQMRHTMRPMMFSFIILIAALMFFGAFYGEVIIPSPVNIPFIGSQLGWFHWYLLIVIPGSIIFKKLLDIV